MKANFIFSVITLFTFLSSCKKEIDFADAPFEIKVEQVSGNDEASFKYSLTSEASFEVWDLFQDSEGNYLVSGAFLSNVRTSNSQSFLMKLNPLGNLLWLKKYDGFPYFLDLDIIDESNQSYFVIGSNLSQPFFIEFSFNGELLANNQINTITYSQFRAHSTVDNKVLMVFRSGDVSNEVYGIKQIDKNSFAELWSSTTLFQTTEVTFFPSGNAFAIGATTAIQNGVPTWYIQKFSDSGDSFWLQAIENNTAGTMTVGRALELAAENFLLPVFISENRNTKAEIRNYDEAGNLVWTHQINGNLYNNTLAGGNQFSFYLNKINSDIFINKLDNQTGQLIWSRNLNTKFSSIVTAVSTQDGGIIIHTKDKNNTGIIVKLDSMGN